MVIAISFRPGRRRLHLLLVVDLIHLLIWRLLLVDHLALSCLRLSLLLANLGLHLELIFGLQMSLWIVNGLYSLHVVRHLLLEGLLARSKSLLLHPLIGLKTWLYLSLSYLPTSIQFFAVNDALIH